MKDTIPCPYCNMLCEADWVDVGVGFVQCGPFHCENCGASEIGSYDEERELTSEEKRTGWYAPNSEPGTSANVINGKIVSHKIMGAIYKQAFIGNPLYDVPGYVEEWQKQLRKKKSKKTRGTKMIITCVKCKQQIDVPVTQEQIDKWKSGTLIQHAMPNISADQRELFLTGLCGKCFDEMCKTHWLVCES